MAKKVFYNKRHKIPKWLQPYLVWFFLLLLASPFLILFGTTAKTPRKFNLINIGATANTEEIKRFQESFRQLPADWHQREKDRSRVGQSLKNLKLKNFRNELVAEENCSNFIFYPENKYNSLILISIPWNAPNGIQLTAAALSAAQQNHRANQSILLLLSDDYNRCRGNRNLRAKLKADFAAQVNSGVVFFQATTEAINPAAGGYRVISVDAAGMIPELKYAGHAAQLIANALPIFFGEGDALLLDGLPLLKVPLQSLPPGNIEVQISGVVARIAQSDPNIFAPKSFWLTTERQLKKGAVVTIVIFLVILCFIPLMNRLTLKRTSFSPVSGTISALYFALIPVLVSLLMRFLPKGKSLATLAIIFAGGVFVLFLLFKRIEKNILSIATDSSSALFFFFIMMAVGSIVNPAAVLLLFPAALLYGFIKESSVATGWFIILLGMALPLTTFWFGQQSFDFLALLSRRETSFEFGWGMAIYLSLLFGSLMSLMNRNVPRLL